ncbi:hypothetical protein GF338_06910 [candidate division WOR-3 bacterium]|nr:hypothetical protein [candidate division WOR-3 bacterium]
MGLNILTFIKQRGKEKCYCGGSVVLWGLLILMNVPAKAVTIYPAGHLSSVVKIRESYFDFSQYNLHATALIEIAPETNVELGVDYQQGESLSPIAWVDYTFLNSLRIQAGRFPMPFGVFNELDNPKYNLLVTTPEICVDAIPAPWIDWGARIQWMQAITPTETFSLSAYICNGLGYGQDLRDSRQMSDNNMSNSYGSRIALISNRFGEFGASGYFGARDDASTKNLGLVGLDLHTDLSILDLRGEYVAGVLEFDEGAVQAIRIGLDELLNSPPGALSWTNGFYFQLALKISKYAVPTVRFDYLGYEDLNLGKRIYQNRFAIGVSCYPIEPLVVKLETGLINDRYGKELQLAPLHLQVGVGI